MTPRCGRSESCNYIRCKEENKPGLSGSTGLVTGTSSLIQETTMIPATLKAGFLGNMDNNTRDSEYRAFRVTHTDRDSHRRLSSACSCLILHNKQGPGIKIPTFPFLIVFPREHMTGEPSLILQHDICLHALQEPSTGSSVTGWRGWGHRMNGLRTVLPTCSHLPWPHCQILLYF